MKAQVFTAPPPELHPCPDRSVHDQRDADIGYAVLALADDWIAEHPASADETTPDDVYDWLVAQGRKLGAQ